MTQNTSQLQENNTKETVLSFINALNVEDFKAARKLVSEDLIFIGVLGTRNGAEAYFSDMEKMKLKYEIKKVFADGDDACLLYNINMGSVTVFASGWYQLANGKISSFKVVFDPRPLLETAAPK
ncbi:SnoaL-like domain-containing protein [Chitinophaga sp. CF118]|uniref:nuclear transport factor 2 family protein n=1 Tax=Chitinophaga sp. CF118 TaxID=1884367 RepID=UPI0008E21EE1|nr:nuclear transport factor 2 family protein [Chitinophaga sp. CF118]SFE97721.1 SnoaL-like domain-containing protein [Chitinophaga sp. CF118]